MFETPTTDPLKTPAQVPPAPPVRAGRLPLELEMEFAEMQAAAPATGTLPGLLGALLLFHALLIAERAFLLMPPSMFAMRGGPTTLVLLLFFLVPAALRHKDVGRAFVVGFSVLLIVALLADVPFTGAEQLLPVQTGVALLLLVLGWLTSLPRHWAAIAAGSAMLADATSLLFGPASRTIGLPIILESLWAPAFASALLVLLAAVRQNEARRDFLMVRQAAFTGIPQEGAETAQGAHLDPETNVANRLAFDMRFRAAWDQAASRRNSVALLFFSIDNFAEQKRDLGYRYSELLQTQIAAILKDGLRRSDDMVARFDNQHFVVMLPGVGTDGATQIAERLRGCIQETPVFFGQKRYNSTATVGVASMRAKRGIPRENLVESAIQALEQARASGPNTVCVEGRGCIPPMS